MDNKKIYNEMWTEWVDMKIYGSASRWLRYLISKSLIYIKDVHTVLDVGCGEGTITNMLAEKLNAQVKGVDFSETGIQCAKYAYDRKNISFECTEEINGKYDLVTAFEVLEHVEDWKNVLNKMILSSNKYVMLSFPTGRMRSFEKNVGHVRNFRKGEVEEYMKEKGFKCVNIFYAGFPFYNPIYREICNITNSGSNSFTKGKYTWKQKIVAFIFYVLFLMSTRRSLGNQFVGTFEK